MGAMGEQGTSIQVSWTGVTRGLLALCQTQGGLWCPQVPFCPPSVVVGTSVGVLWAPPKLPRIGS